MSSHDSGDKRMIGRLTLLPLPAFRILGKLITLREGHRSAY
jgi:hypothetical protein